MLYLYVLFVYKHVLERCLYTIHSNHQEADKVSCIHLFLNVHYMYIESSQEMAKFHKSTSSQVKHGFLYKEKQQYSTNHISQIIARLM